MEFPTKEETDEVIEKLANLISRKYKLSELAIFLLQSREPMAPLFVVPVFSTLFPFESALSPIFEKLTGISDFNVSENIVALLDDPANIKKLINRVEEIAKEVRKEEAEQKPYEKESGFPSRLINLNKLKVWLKTIFG